MSTEDENLLKEAKKLPWEERLTHNDWKVRKDANIDLAAVCGSITDPKDPRILEFGPFFKEAVADSNASVQEKALVALIFYLKAADADAARYAKEICDSIVESCLTGMPTTIDKTRTALLLWVELEAVDAVLDAMEKAIKHNVPEAVVLAIDVMVQALSEFGTKVVPPKRILKMLPELFDHQDQNVVDASEDLLLELGRSISKDKEKELESELENVTEMGQPTRKIRSEQDKEPEPEAISEAVVSGTSEEAAEAPISTSMGKSSVATETAAFHELIAAVNRIRERAAKVEGTVQKLNERAEKLANRIEEGFGEEEFVIWEIMAALVAMIPLMAALVTAYI